MTKNLNSLEPLSNFLSLIFQSPVKMNWEVFNRQANMGRIWVQIWDDYVELGLEVKETGSWPFWNRKLSSQSDQVQLITSLMIRVVNDNKYSTSRSRKGSMYFFKPTSRLIRLFRLRLVDYKSSRNKSILTQIYLKIW